MTEDVMDGWHNQFNGHEFQQALEVSDRQRSLACCSPCGHEESGRIEGLNGSELKELNDIVMCIPCGGTRTLP